MTERETLALLDKAYILLVRADERGQYGKVAKLEKIIDKLNFILDTHYPIVIQ